MISIIMVSAGPHWERLTAPAIEGLRKYASKEHELIVVDNGGTSQGDINIDTMVPYGEAVNRGAYMATGDRLLILNNDIIVTGDYMATLGQNNIEGPTIRVVEGNVSYIEGWAISIDHRLWNLLGGFDINYSNRWEDVDLSWRASLLNWAPAQLDSFPISHIYNGTRQYTPSANDKDFPNRCYFLRKRSLHDISLA